MKIYSDFAFKLICVYILCLSIFSISTFEIDTNTIKTNSLNSDKILNSDYLTLDDEKVSEINNETTKVEIKEETKPVIVQVDEFKKELSLTLPNIDVSTVPVLATDTITMSHYGHDCGGCKTGKTASGYYIGDGKIYYNDKTFGSVRIVAADKKYPFGTILRLNGELAIVLDRGGVGDGKKFQIDLLVTSESESSKLGVKRNVSLEVLRLGY